MASKVAGVLIMCLILAATFGTGEAWGEVMDEYGQCAVDCHKSCEGKGETACRLKCDGECMAQEAVAKVVGH